MKLLKSIAALALVSSVVVANAQVDPQSMTGKPMPKFTMKDTKGKAVTNASLKGKVVLVDFWATWCGPCKAASPLMQTLHKKYAKSGLVVVGANVSDSPGAAPKYAKEHGYSYLFTTGGEDLQKKFGITAIPGFVFVDRKGVVRRVQLGYGPSLEADFDATVKKLLAAK
jgi:thiol-disulfide isomerase/thioredoxin